MKLAIVGSALLFCAFLPIQSEHYMLKELCEQKAAINRTIDYCKQIDTTKNGSAEHTHALLHQLGLTAESVKQISSIHLVGAGTSWHASHIGQYFFEQVCQLPTSVSLASEFPYVPFFHPSKTLHLLLSQSGETSDVVEAMRFIQGFDQQTLAVVNVVPSTMARQASGYLHMQAGPERSVPSTKVFSNQVATLYWLAHKIALERGTINQATMQQAEADLAEAADVLESTMEQYKTSIINDLAPRYAAYKNFIFTGRQVSYPLAMEAALKLKETSYLFTQAYPAGELRHGPIALVDEDTVVTLFSVLDQAAYEKLIINAQAVKACKGQLIVYAFQGQDELIRLADVAFVLPPVKPLLAPLAMTGLMQFFIYRIACELGVPIDTPRNLSKAVVGNEVPNTTPQKTRTTRPAKRVLVCAPHPDDEIIGCGGSIMHHKEQGDHVSIVYITSGDAGSVLYTKEALAAIREQEAAQGAKIVGADALYFLRNPDGYVAYSPANIISLVNLIRSVQPDIVYIPHKHDAHKDHLATHELVCEAIGRAGGPFFQECTGAPWAVSTVLGYEVHTPLQEVTYIRDITAHMATKLQALRQHASQLQTVGYDDAFQGLNRYRGAMSGKGDYCECFQVIKT